MLLSHVSRFNVSLPNGFAAQVENPNLTRSESRLVLSQTLAEHGGDVSAQLFLSGSA